MGIFLLRWQSITGTINVVVLQERARKRVKVMMTSMTDFDHDMPCNVTQRGGAYEIIEDYRYVEDAFTMIHEMSFQQGFGQNRAVQCEAATKGNSPTKSRSRQV